MSYYIKAVHLDTGQSALILKFSEKPDAQAKIDELRSKREPGEPIVCGIVELADANPRKKR